MQHFILLQLAFFLLIRYHFLLMGADLLLQTHVRVWGELKAEFGQGKDIPSTALREKYRDALLLHVASLPGVFLLYNAFSVLTSRAYTQWQRCRLLTLLVLMAASYLLLVLPLKTLFVPAPVIRWVSHHTYETVHGWTNAVAPLPYEPFSDPADWQDRV